jgi:signal peptidase I
VATPRLSSTVVGSWASNAEPEASRPPNEDAGFVPHEGGEERDLVLRAFEAHANVPAQSGPPGEWVRAEDASPHEPGAFSNLLGDDAEEFISPAAPAPTFARLQGWAPQRSSTSAPAPEAPPTEDWTERSSRFDTDWEMTGDAAVAGEPIAWSPMEDAAAEADEERRRRRTRTLIRELVETGLLALLVFLAVRASFQNFRVDGQSMYPTLDNGQFLIVNKLVYSEVDVGKLGNFLPFIDPGDKPKRNVFHGAERGDIVVVKDPRNPSVDLIKRVVGLPGETVEISQGVVYINDHRLIEPYIKQEWHDNKPKVLIPAAQYFVMGDNRDNSLDSRSTAIGLVPKDLIIGKAMVSYWPRDKFGLAPNESPSLSEETLRPKAAANPQ